MSKSEHALAALREFRNAAEHCAGVWHSIVSAYEHLAAIHVK